MKNVSLAMSRIGRRASQVVAALILHFISFASSELSEGRQIVTGGKAMKTAPTYRYQLTGGKSKRKTGPDVFEGTLQKTQVWLNDLMFELDWEDRPQKAYLALRTVLHALRDRLTVEEAVQLGAQLPMLVRGFYFEGWTLRDKPHKERHKEDFLAHVKEAFKDNVTVNPQQVVRAVFKVLAKHTSAGEIEDVKHILPKALRELWP
jgi:uncharacterized protein (DUF2267 family)